MIIHISFQQGFVSRGKFRVYYIALVRGQDTQLVQHIAYACGKLFLYFQKHPQHKLHLIIQNVALGRKEEGRLILKNEGFFSFGFEL